MPHRHHHHVRQDSSDSGWAGYVQGHVGANDHYMERSGGWANDGRSLVARILDMVAYNAVVIIGVLALMAMLTWLVDH